MSFVFEKIPDAERNKLVGIRGEFGGAPDPILYDRWVIDRERNVFLMWLGGSGGGPHGRPSSYVFSWHGRLIYMSALEEITGNPHRPEGAHVTRTFINFRVPDEFEADRVQLLSLLKEAFDTYGYVGISNVRVHLNFT